MSRNYVLIRDGPCLEEMKKRNNDFILLVYLTSGVPEYGDVIEKKQKKTQYM